MEKMHFRILVLEEDRNIQRDIEKHVLSTFIHDGRNFNFEDAQFYFVDREEQLEHIPGIVNFNSIWISMNFPGWRELVCRFYGESPFSYQVLCGERVILESDLLRSRPFGFISHERSEEEIHREMRAITEMFGRERNMLRLQSRSSILWVPYGSVVYLQSRGRRSYIYLNACGAADPSSEEDIFVKSADGRGELFAYTQNKKLDELLDSEALQYFVRIHKSYAVNRAYVRGLTKGRYGWVLSVCDASGRSLQLPVSDPYHNTVERLMSEKM